MKNIRGDRAGFALPLAVMFTLLMALLTAFAMQKSSQNKIMFDDVSVRQPTSYYRAKVGMIDADARIRNNYTAGLVGGTGSPAGADFLDPNYNPAPYHLDLDFNPPTVSSAGTRPSGYEVTIDISAVNKNNDGTAAGQPAGMERRSIEVTARETL